MAIAVIAAGAVGASCGATPRVDATPPSASVEASRDLRGADAFADIADRGARSRALFAEASRVLLDPRCTNCHPSDDSPRQRDGAEMHDPPVVRGPDDRGPPGMGCATCHQEANVPGTRVPGAHDWHLAPRSMAWIGKTPAAVCAQIKDPARNGKRTLEQIVEHAAHDPLVAWGWAPGADRRPAPGTQARFGELMAAWVSTGAACPGEEERR